MTAATLATIAGIGCLVAEAVCAGCRKALVLIQMPGAKVTDADCLCWDCAPTKRAQPREET